MKSDDKSLFATLNRYCRKSGSPSAAQVTVSVEKVWEQLRTEAETMPLADRKVVPRRFRFTLVFAVLVATSAIGAYAAYRGGLLSTRQDVSPAAPLPTPSARAKAEPPQVAVITPASTRPATAPSREEALARVASQIAAAQATDTGAARPKFAAASVRPVPAGPPDINNGLKCLGVDGTVSATARRGRCTGQTDLGGLVLAAYRIDPPIVFVTEGGGTRITGIPDSLRGRFQIEAVADDTEHVTERELKLMLQTLLEDRFKARVHLEMREVDGYVLTIAKSGIKFKETSVDEKASATTLTPVQALEQSRERCQYNGRLARPVEIFVRGKCGMKELSTYVGKMLLPLNIADKTGLMGIYNIDFVLEPVYLDSTGAGGRGGGGGQPARQFTTPIPKALEEQLGLHLERTKIPVEFVVVDHIEQPTEN